MCSEYGETIPVQNAQSTSLIQSPGKPSHRQQSPPIGSKRPIKHLFQNALTRVWYGLEAITRLCSDGRLGARFLTIMSWISTGALSSGGILREEDMMFQVTVNEEAMTL